MENLHRKPNKTRRVYRLLVSFSQIMAGVLNKLHVFFFFCIFHCNEKKLKSLGNQKIFIRWYKCPQLINTSDVFFLLIK